jgi:hypothetical protein
MKRFTAGAACLAVLALVVTPLVSDAARKRPAPRLAVATVQGPDIEVAPLSVNAEDYVVRCRRGWQTTGFGVLNGATDIVYADPTSDGRGYVFAFGNPSSSSPFTASGNVRCVKGGKGLRVRKATSGRSPRAAVREWEAAH